MVLWCLGLFCVFAIVFLYLGESYDFASYLDQHEWAISFKPPLNLGRKVPNF